MKIFENTTALAAATLTAGQMVSVKEIGEYRIKASGSGITLANGNIAVPVASGTAVNVKQFGAVGDGVTDDTAAIQAALAYISTNGASLDIPLGTYKYVWASKFTITNGNIIGSGGTFLLNTGAATSSNDIVFEFSAASKIKNVNFTHQGTSRYLCAIHLSGDNAEIDSCVFSGDFGRAINSGVVAQTGENLKITNNRITSSTDGLGSNIKLGDGSYVARNVIHGGNEGIVSNATITKGVTIKDNILSGFDEAAIDIIGGVNVLISGNRISGLLNIDGGASSDGLPIRVGQAGYECYRCVITDNVIVDCPIFAISTYSSNSMDGATNRPSEATFVISNNIIDGFNSTGRGGYAILASAVNAKIDGNLIKGGTGDGINVSKSSGAVIRDNTIIDVSGGGIKAGQDGGTVYNRGIVIAGNSLFDTEEAGIVLGWRVHSAVIRDNIFEKSTSTQTIALQIEYTVSGDSHYLFEGNTVHSDLTTPINFIGGTSTQASIVFGDNFDQNGVNRTRYKSKATGFGGTDTLTITHGLWFAPTSVIATPSFNAAIWLDSTTSTQFVLKTSSAAPGGASANILATC